jgi:hypothetical protein
MTDEQIALALYFGALALAVAVARWWHRSG